MKPDRIDMKIVGDETAAEALRIAERWLIKQGWKFEPRDIANRANEILDVLTGRVDL